MIRILVASFVLLVSLQTLHGKERPTAGVGEALTVAAQKFVAALNDQELSKATMNFDDPARQDWHNIPKPKRKGMQFRDMNATQKAGCLALLRAALSESGYDKAVKIMSLENNLREGEKNLKNGPLRDPERYFLTIFGKPDTAGTWGWSFEGHHLSLNFVIRDGEVVSDTPSFWGANPATVTTFIEGGPATGTRTLGSEEQLAFDLLNQLDADQKRVAIIADKAPAEYRTPGRPQPVQAAPEGLAVGKMTQSQFAPVPISDGFWVVPSWHEVPAGATRVIRLDPGLAFGTGTHPTTRMCLRWLAGHAALLAAPGARVLDYGCGSGILAIGAALHGAADIDAVDIDPAAVQATEANARANGVALRAGLPEQASGRYALVLANILATPLQLLAPLLCARLQPGAPLVLAGILERQAEQLAAAYAPWLELQVSDAQDGWILMAGRLPDTP